MRGGVILIEREGREEDNHQTMRRGRKERRLTETKGEREGREMSKDGESRPNRLSEDIHETRGKFSY